MATPIEAMLANLAGQFLGQLMTNPESLTQLGQMLGGIGCHTAVDVAQDALDAYEAGHLTAEQAQRIIAIALESKTRRPVRPVADLGQPPAIAPSDLAAFTQMLKQSLK